MKNKKVIILISFIILIILLIVLFIKLKNKKSSVIECPKGKTIKTLSINDDIKIEGENFKVLKTDEKNVYAMPYYNITLSVTDPMQTKEPLDHHIKFVSTGNNYWKEDDDLIDMENNNNNIQKYINAYSNKLHSMDKRISARVARYSEMKDDNMNNDLRNPGKDQIFWIGSAYSKDHVYYIDKYGYIDDDYYEGDIGVRPIIIINKK